MSSDRWLEDGPTEPPPTRRRNLLGIVLGAGLCLIVVVVPAVIASGGYGSHASPATSSHPMDRWNTFQHQPPDNGSDIGTSPHCPSLDLPGPRRGQRK
jgi:hypothetical protein